MNCLDKPETQFADLPGIVSFNISNLIADDGEYKPYRKEVIKAAEISTKVDLFGSDHVNLLTQARAMLVRSSIAPFLLEDEFVDIVKIVKIGYLTDVLLKPAGLVNSDKEIAHDMHAINLAFKNPKRYHRVEKVRMVQEFQRAIQDLYITELLIHSDEFKIDSIVIGLGKMTYEEKILRARINVYIETEILKMIKRVDGDTDSIKHIETHSLPIILGDRIKECTKFYNNYGGGSFRKNNVLYFGSGTAREIHYDIQSDYFPATISQFYEDNFVGKDS